MTDSFILPVCLLIIIKRVSASYFYISISYLYGDIALWLIIALPTVGVICRSYLPCRASHQAAEGLQRGVQRCPTMLLFYVHEYVSTRKFFFYGFVSTFGNCDLYLHSGMPLI